MKYITGEAVKFREKYLPVHLHYTSYPRWSCNGVTQGVTMRLVTFGPNFCVFESVDLALKRPVSTINLQHLDGCSCCTEHGLSSLHRTRVTHDWMPFMDKESGFVVFVEPIILVMAATVAAFTDEYRFILIQLSRKQCINFICCKSTYAQKHGPLFLIFDNNDWTKRFLLSGFGYVRWDPKIWTNTHTHTHTFNHMLSKKCSYVQWKNITESVMEGSFGIQAISVTILSRVGEL